MRVRFGAAFLWFLTFGKYRQLLHLNGCDCIKHVDFHLLALTGSFAVQQRRYDTFKGSVGCDCIHQKLAGSKGWFTVSASRKHCTRHALKQQILPRSVFIRARFAVARH